MSIHVCKCDHNGRTEYHLRYPGMSKDEAQWIADEINGGALTDGKKAARTQPAQEVPRLTDEEIDDIQRDNNAAYHRGDVTPRRFARAIESALLAKMGGGK